MSVAVTEILKNICPPNKDGDSNRIFGRKVGIHLPGNKVLQFTRNNVNVLITDNAIYERSNCSWVSRER